MKTFCFILIKHDSQEMGTCTQVGLPFGQPFTLLHMNHRIIELALSITNPRLTKPEVCFGGCGIRFEDHI
jgi:hypothetical protein